MELSDHRPIEFTIEYFPATDKGNERFLKWHNSWWDHSDSVNIVLKHGMENACVAVKTETFSNTDLLPNTIVYDDYLELEFAEIEKVEGNTVDMEALKASLAGKPELKALATA